MLERDELIHMMARTCEALLAWWSDCLARLVRALSRLFPSDEARSRPAGSSRSAGLEPLLSLNEPPKVQVLAEEPLDSSGGHTGPSSEPSAANVALEPPGNTPRPRAPLKPPPAITELPVLRLAEVPEPKDAEDVYPGESLSHAARLWPKRIVVLIALAAGGFLAATTWESWWPKAIRLGPLVFNEIDKRLGSGDATEQQGRALREATEQLPHLAPETIRLVLSTSPTGVLDVVEVARLANEAAGRGISTLTPSEAEELTALSRSLLDALTPAERERMREYERARARLFTSPSEDRAVLELLARGARALPSTSRQRLHALGGKAVAAGLQRPGE